MTAPHMSPEEFAAVLISVLDRYASTLRIIARVSSSYVPASAAFDREASHAAEAALQCAEGLDRTNGPDVNDVEQLTLAALIAAGHTTVLRDALALHAASLEREAAVVRRALTEIPAGPENTERPS